MNPDDELNNYLKHKEIVTQLFEPFLSLRYSKVLLKEYFKNHGEKGLLDLKRAVKYHFHGVNLSTRRTALYKLIEKRISFETKWYYKATWWQWGINILIGIISFCLGLWIGHKPC